MSSGLIDQNHTSIELTYFSVAWSQNCWKTKEYDGTSAVTSNRELGIKIVSSDRAELLSVIRVFEGLVNNILILLEL